MQDPAAPAIVAAMRQVRALGDLDAFHMVTWGPMQVG